MNIIHGAPIPPVGMLLYKLNSAYVLWTNYSLEAGNEFLDCAKLVKSLMLHCLCGVWYSIVEERARETCCKNKIQKVFSPLRPAKQA